jgi:spore germination protein GerM
MRVLVLAVLVSLALGACGIDGQRRAVAVEGAELPVEQAPAEAAGSADTLTLYLVGEGHLQAVTRPGQASSAGMVRSLLKGPRDTEADLGLRSAVPPGTTLLGATMVDGEARLDFSEEFTSIVGDEHLLALAQVVFTATEDPAVRAVRFSVEGEPVAVARADGQLTARAVDRADYSTLGPP